MRLPLSPNSKELQSKAVMKGLNYNGLGLFLSYTIQQKYPAVLKP